MIERLKSGDSFFDKINEIIDAINKQSDHRCCDKYAKERKWMGYLCKFWDDYEDDCTYGVLNDMDTGAVDLHFYCQEADEWYMHVSPVSMDIIYKGYNE